MDRKLASIQRITNIEPIPEADRIEKISLLGWHVVSQKGIHAVNNLVVYLEVDSLLPIDPRYEFLRKGCGVYKNRNDGSEWFRLKTIKLKKQISQGLILPLSDFPEIKDPKEGDDVTEILKIVKYEPYVAENMRGVVKGNFPSFIRKTDETRLQSVPSVLTRHDNVECYTTEKLDGTSSTFYYNEGVFGVCSRNLDLKESDVLYWKIARELDLEKKMKEYGRALAVQGEIVGNGIQKNPYNLPGHKLYVFSVYNISTGLYLTYKAMKEVTDLLGLELVPLVAMNMHLNESTVDKMVEFSKGASKLNPNSMREGIVIRSVAPRKDEDLGNLSFKVINPDYLLKMEKDE